MVLAEFKIRGLDLWFDGHPDSVVPSSHLHLVPKIDFEQFKDQLGAASLWPAKMGRFHTEQGFWKGFDLGGFII